MNPSCTSKDFLEAQPWGHVPTTSWYLSRTVSPTLVTPFGTNCFAMHHALHQSRPFSR